MATVRIRHTFQPRDEVEVDESEAKVLAEQGLLYDGTQEDLAELFASDPVGPLDPPRVYTPPTAGEPQDKAPAPAVADAKPAKATAAPADKAPAAAADTAKGA